MTAFLPILTVASENKSYLHCNAYLSRVGLHYFHEWKSYLKTKSIRRSYKKTDLVTSSMINTYRVSQNICDFLTLKMLTLTLALIKTKNRHLFDKLVKN